MKVSDLKGEYGQNMMCLLNTTIHDLIVNNIIKNKLNYNISKTYQPQYISALNVLRKMFTLSGLYNNIDHQIYKFLFAIPEDVVLKIWENPKSYDYKIFECEDSFDFIDSYKISVTIDCYDKSRYDFNNNNNQKYNYICAIDINYLHANLEQACLKCKPVSDPNAKQFKDMHGNIINMYDEIIWTKMSGDGYLRYSTVSGFGYNYIKTDDGHKVSVSEKYVNRHISVVYNKINWSGFKI